MKCCVAVVVHTVDAAVAALEQHDLDNALGLNEYGIEDITTDSHRGLGSGRLAVETTKAV